jgi:hypothetical protein
MEQVPSRLIWPILRRWRWRLYVPPKRRLSLKGLHGVISQKREFFNGNLDCGCLRDMMMNLRAIK